MSSATAYWFSPAPSEVTSSRLSLDFGLRAADLFFRELVVPELGRIWFARQLSWPLAALALHEELAGRGANAPKPTAICHGIEALACKLEYLVDPQDPSPRILGRRAFGRNTDREVWSFHRLRHASNYVRNTHRQAATRAVRVDGGLGFARGSRFDLLELEPVGRALARAFLDQRVVNGGTSLRKWLLGWVYDAPRRKDDEARRRLASLKDALSPEHPTDEECVLVRSRVLGTLTPASEKRQRLARAVGRATDMPDIEGAVVVRLRDAGHREQANEIIAARAFGAVLDRARDAVAQLTSDRLGIGRAPVKLATLTNDTALKKAIKDLRSAAKSYVDKATIANVNEADSRKFAAKIVDHDDETAIRDLVERSRQLLDLAGGSIIRGSLFRNIGSVDELNGDNNEPDVQTAKTKIPNPLSTWRTFRIANLHALLRDVERRGTR